MPNDQHDPIDPLDPTAPAATDSEAQADGLPDDFEWKLLFDRAPELDADKIRAGMLKHGLAQEPILISPITLDEEDGESHCSVDFDGHFLLLIRWPHAIPSEVISTALNSSNHSAADKAPLRQHKQHMTLQYLGGWDDPTERLIAMMRVAAAFRQDGLKGIIDLPAWNAIPAARLTEWLKPASLAEMRKLPPLAVLAGFVKMFKTPDKREVCFCTKGLHRWSVNDFAMDGTMKDADEAYNLFEALFAHSLTLEYLIQPGHTAEVGNTILRFSEVEECPEMYATPLGTLLLERIKRSKMH